MDCTGASAEEIGACVGELFTNPNSTYSPGHVRTKAEQEPEVGPRIAPDAARAGAWQVVADAVVDGERINAVHVSLTPRSKVLITAGSGNDPNYFAAGTFLTFVWDPAANTMAKVPTPADLFCAGHMQLPDGRLLFFGGTAAYPDPARGFLGANFAYTFDDLSNQYAKLPPMHKGRWYPGGVADAGGNPVVVSGLDETGQLTDVNETYNIGLNQWHLLAPRLFPLYPQLMLAGNGKLFYTGVNVFGKVGVLPGIWNQGTNEWQPVDGLPDIDCRDQGVALLMYPAQAQKFIAIGGGCATGTTNSTGIVDLATAAPAYAPGPPLPFGSMHLCGLNLPDGSVFVAGGGDHNTSPVLRAALLRPGAPAWEEVASPGIGRMYHSACILAADGSVLTFGSDQAPNFETRIERYDPWYMSEPRPAITELAGTFKLGGTYPVAYTSTNGVKEAMLIRPSSVTHSSDPNQRAVRVPVTLLPDGRAELAIEANPGILPPGYYMLFLLDERGVPSEARFVQITP